MAAAVLAARICATIALMGALHVAVMLEHPEYSLVPLPLYFLALGLAGKHRRGSSARVVLCAAATLVLGWEASSDLALLRLSPYLIPVLVNLFLLFQFGRTLLPGREPLIVRYCRTELGTVPVAVERYAARLTAFWCVVFVLMIVECAALAEYASMEVWSLFANVLNYALVLFLFVGEHVVRSIVFPEYGIASPIRTGRAMLRTSLDAVSGA